MHLYVNVITNPTLEASCLCLVRKSLPDTTYVNSRCPKLTSSCLCVLIQISQEVIRLASAWSYGPQATPIALTWKLGTPIRKNEAENNEWLSKIKLLPELLVATMLKNHCEQSRFCSWSHGQWVVGAGPYSVSFLTTSKMIGWIKHCATS